MGNTVSACSGRGAADPRATRKHEDYAPLFGLGPQTGTRIPNPEDRGITLNQLRRVYGLACQLCKAERWRSLSGALVSPESMTLYDLVHYLIRPVTSVSLGLSPNNNSLVELIAVDAAKQKPRVFVSHWCALPSLLGGWCERTRPGF